MQKSIGRFALAMFAVGMILSAAPPADAQRITSQDLARAIERDLVDAIAGAEKSVVAIARVHQETPDEVLHLELRPDPFGRPSGMTGGPAPTDPDFIPNEYATGVVVGRGGLILTTYHFLAPQSDYYVTTPDRRVYRATIKAADPRGDLAVLEIKASELTPIRMNDGAPLRKGQIVIALGNPHAIARDGQASAAWGIVANLARKAPPEPGTSPALGKTTLHHYGTLIQTDAKLNVGNSGGPLLDLSGRMVGLLTSLPAPTGYQREAGYAIPVDATFRRIVDALKQGREVEYGFLGIQPANLSEEEIRSGLRGMRIDRVTPGPGTPAAAGGLRAGDILTAVNGIPIIDADHLVLEVGRLPVDSLAKFTILRRDRERTLNVRLGKYPVRGRKIVTNAPDRWRGIAIDYPTVLIDSRYRAPSSPVYFEDAVLVTEVEEDSPAWNAGLRPGMSISHVAGRKVRTPDEFRTTVAGRSGPVSVRVTEDDSPNRVISPGT